MVPFLVSHSNMSWMSAPDFIAPQDSLLGLLQRGRGEGYRRILQAPKNEAHDLLVKGITRDSRIDSQVESRDKYYASIAFDISLPVEPLGEHLRQHDDQTQGSWATPLTVTTLSQLAKRDYRNAKDVLCDYISWGQWWDWPLDDLFRLPDEELHARVARAVEQHFPTDDLLDDAMTWPAEQFTILSQFSSRIQSSLAKANLNRVSKTEGDLPDLSALSPRELLSLANKDNHRKIGKALANRVKPADIDMLVSQVSLQAPFVSHVALAGLTQLAPPALSGWLSELWLSIPEKSDPSNAAHNLSRVVLRQSFLRAILAMPVGETLPLARDWITQQDSQKQDMAEKLLQEHATPSDVPLLRAALRPMLNDEEAEWGCFIIRAFYHLPKIGVIPELVDIYHQFRFSMGRSYAARAIQVTSPELFKDKFATECLWDCEEGTRELGAKFAPLESKEANDRIQHLAQSPFEANNPRKEAQNRLL
jgi:hypothetical protein